MEPGCDSLLLAPGSCLLAPGSCLLAPSPWLLAPGSWLLAPGSWDQSGHLITCHLSPAPCLPTPDLSPAGGNCPTTSGGKWWTWAIPSTSPPAPSLSSCQVTTWPPTHLTTRPPGHLATWSPDHLPLKGGVGPAMGLWRDDQFKGKSGAADAPKVHTGHCPKPHLRERNILYS